MARISQPRSSTASTAAAAAPARLRRRRTGASSSSAARLGTLLHLNHLPGLGRSRRRQRRDRRARRLRGNTIDGKRDRNRRSLVELAFYRHFAAMQVHEALHDRETEAGSLVPPLIGLAGLEKWIADALQVVGRDPD